jgi:hypothetical protein
LFILGWNVSHNLRHRLTIVFVKIAGCVLLAQRKGNAAYPKTVLLRLTGVNFPFLRLLFVCMARFLWLTRCLFAFSKFWWLSQRCGHCRKSKYPLQLHKPHNEHIFYLNAHSRTRLDMVLTTSLATDVWATRLNLILLMNVVVVERGEDGRLPVHRPEDSGTLAFAF